MRFGLNRDLGFSERDRNENIRRIAEVAKLFADSCTIAITSFISPYRKDREMARKLHEGAERGDQGLGFIEVWVDCPVEVAEQRDPKGLYKKARTGEIKEFTGVSAPYEAPQAAEVHVRSDIENVEQSVQKVVEFLEGSGYLTKERKV